MALPTNASAVRSVDRAAALLIALGDLDGEAGVTELARRLGLHKSTASRLLATLQRRGLVEQDAETGRYRLGVAVIRLAQRAELALDLRGLAQPDLDRLARATRLRAELTVHDGEGILVLAQAETGAKGTAERNGPRPSIHASAAGKVLLAAMAERDVARLSRRGLPALTPRTITALEPLLAELARTRRRGYATARGEEAADVAGVAAPVVDARGAVIAAVQLRGPNARFGRDEVVELAGAARRTAAAISSRIGATP